MSETNPQYDELIVDGIVSATPVTADEIESDDKVIVLMGPTGSGKSSFIEALVSRDPGGPLGIAKDQLESVTHHVSIYRLNNIRDLRDRRRFFIVDTPGLADPKISELRVLGEVKDWRDRCNNVDPIRVLYFHPITDVRMPASKKKCMEILKSFWGAYNLPTAKLVTTMWDCLRPSMEEQAEERFADISSKGHWGDWGEVAENVDVPLGLKFTNTFESAMGILNNVCEIASAFRPTKGPPEVDGHGAVDPRTGVLLVEQTLRERIESLHRQLESIEDELHDPAVQENEELMCILLSSRNSRRQTLDTFSRELEEFISQQARAPT